LWPSVEPEGIFISEFECGEIGPDLLRQACKFGLEGLVSKHKDRSYRGGRQPHWIKVKNRSHPALEWVKESRSRKGVVSHGVQEGLERGDAESAATPAFGSTFDRP
jgi:ATP-dependent DNA ligase